MSTWNKVFRTMFLKLDAVGIKPRANYLMGIISLLKVFNGWRILGGLETLFMPVMGENIHLVGVKM